jgi:hypothetical protein
MNIFRIKSTASSSISLSDGKNCSKGMPENAGKFLFG